ncbi:MAG: phospho-N-acetylmuramoyl-pentapeptide-transferase [Leptospirales bacterium]|nr:phospho-N-acetylmuramoyl-pentapeptide-transferase [Leptospirales bacterium]
MFEWIYTEWYAPSFFRLFGYVSFRGLMAALTAMGFTFLFGNRIIGWLQKLKFGETIRSDGPQSHQSKAGTPTMGGLLILASLSVACFLFGNFHNLHFLSLWAGVTALGAIGFRDDYSKVVLKKKGGMSARMKMALTLAVALAFCYAYYRITPDMPQNPRGVAYNNTGLFVPFLNRQLIDLGVWIALPFWIVVIVGSCHAVNLTDGLDGLAIGNVLIVAVTLGALTYITGTPRAANYLKLPLVENAHEVSVFLAAMCGAGVGFLWFNAAPARVFMGDTGSLALGGAIGMSAIIIKKEVLLVIMGGVFVLEALSVILQVGSFKLRGKRIFKMAPLHHHFELLGWPETRVVVRFWLIGVILNLLSLSTLRIQ